jgi:hypothetical protein
MSHTCTPVVHARRSVSRVSALRAARAVMASLANLLPPFRLRSLRFSVCERLRPLRNLRQSFTSNAKNGPDLIRPNNSTSSFIAADNNRRIA